MNKDKDLLLKYLCMALPYHVLVHSRAGGNDYELREVNVYSGSFGGTCAIPIPYLRPMSSMTNEELFEVQDIIGKGVEIRDIFILIVDSSINSFTYLELQAVFEWLLKNHFDFMGLIPKGLAIEVTENNNPYKD